MRCVKPIEPGDFVRLATLPSGCEPTPIAVTGVSPNGMIRLLGQGWFQPYLLVRVDPPAKLLARKAVDCVRAPENRRA